MRFLPATHGDGQVWPLTETPELTTRVTGELVISENSQHLYQVITGFLLLQRASIVDVSLRFDKSYRPQLPSSHVAELRVNGGATIAYDMIDGYNFVGPVGLSEYLGRVDCYFKRSFDAASHATVANASRIVPFGLNYPVTVNHRFFAGLDSSGLRGWPERAARLIVGARSLDVSRFEDVPRHRRDPLVLFQTRTWDPAEVAANDAWKIEREQMNEMRAACVRMLRKEFGDRFRGGFMPTDHARRDFPDCVIDQDAASKRRYMQTLKDADICVATAGLHGSNGWSLGEYVAASKAVVSQRLRYDVPGFRDGQHYLGFSTPEECVDRASTLFSEHERRGKMKVANFTYYHQFLRPDRLVLNSLLLAMDGGRST